MLRLEMLPTGSYVHLAHVGKGARKRHLKCGVSPVAHAVAINGHCPRRIDQISVEFMGAKMLTQLLRQALVGRHSTNYFTAVITDRHIWVALVLDKPRPHPQTLFRPELLARAVFPRRLGACAITGAIVERTGLGSHSTVAFIAVSRVLCHHRSYRPRGGFCCVLAQRRQPCGNNVSIRLLGQVIYRLQVLYLAGILLALLL